MKGKIKREERDDDDPTMAAEECGRAGPQGYKFTAGGVPEGLIDRRQVHVPVGKGAILEIGNAIKNGDVGEDQNGKGGNNGESSRGPG